MPDILKSCISDTRLHCYSYMILKTTRNRVLRFLWRCNNKQFYKPLTQVHSSCSIAHSFTMSSGITSCVNLQMGSRLRFEFQQNREKQYSSAFLLTYLINSSIGQNSSHPGSIRARGFLWPNRYITRTSRPLKTWI